jgi:predicted dehydrogenase
MLGIGEVDNNPEGVRMTNTTRRGFMVAAAGVGAGLALAKPAAAALLGGSSEAEGVAGLKTPALKAVRAAFIGVGARGSGHLGQMMTLEGVEVTAICDNHAPSLNNAVDRVVKAGRPKPAAFGNGDEDYKRMLERDDIDIVIIATPWELHTPMCVAAMKAGKHAFTEVPAAVTLEECWELVDTAEKTRKHCMMMENCCYGREELMLLNMCRSGVLGELLHGEAAYIHDLRGQMNEVEHGTGSWRTWHYARRNGNLYPTHGLGPVAQYMSINRGDRFDYMSAVASPALGRAMFAQKHYPPDHKWNKVAKWNCGDINTTIIKTALGRSIMVQWDETTPRPYSRIDMISGTRGTFAGYPSRLVIEGETPGTHEWVEGDKLNAYFEKYDHPLWKARGETAKTAGGHGGMDWLMLWRIVTCLRAGEALDQDVYDAASWSAIGPLSEQSIAKRSTSVDVPDFTRGRWKTTQPLGIVS